MNESNSPDTESIKVLMVDDHELNRELLTDYLEAQGFQVISCADGLTALESLPKVHPNVVIMDVQMPGVDGLEITRRIRRLRDATLAKVPILGLTALAMPEDKDKCLNAGMDDYLGKPFSLKALPPILRRLASQTTGG
jgi:CheY-like chemotaxis protein